ncbi:MAG: addiction module toxin, HicA family [Luteitalea sp.]|nr:addiction module toxin, HicA family [Luteitalea sp.]
MPKLPRDVTQSQVVSALVKAGGVEVKDVGKGSHRAVEMPNRHTVIIPRKVKPGLLSSVIKAVGLTLDQFLRYL